MDYRVTIKVRNNRILKAIDELGGSQGQKWCEANGMCYTMVNNLINMTSSPLGKNGSLSKTAMRLCDVLGKLPDDLWNNDQLYPLERNFSEMEMDYAQIVATFPFEQQFCLPYFHGMELAETRDIVSRALSTLKPRERDVIYMLFNEDLTYDECAQRLGVSRERIRQIEQKAIRKLRDKPVTRDMLLNALDLINDG